MELCIKNQVYKYFVFARSIHIRSDSTECFQFIVSPSVEVFNFFVFYILIIDV